jgi:hypothetical protein
LHVPQAAIWAYASTTSQQDGKFPVTAIQHALGCHWFSLEICFRLSKFDLFTALERTYPELVGTYSQHNPIALLNSNPRNRDPMYSPYVEKSFAKQYIWRNVKPIFPSKIPTELASVFISCQPPEVLAQLEDEIRDSIVSSKGRSLMETIARRNQAGQMLYHENFSADRKNHAIRYTEIKYLDEII